MAFVDSYGCGHFACASFVAFVARVGGAAYRLPLVWWLGAGCSMTDFKTQLDAMRSLEENWNGHGAVPINLDVIEAVTVFLDAIIAKRIAIVPTGDGGIALEIHSHGWDIEVEFEPPIHGDDYRGGSVSWARIESD